MPSTFLSVNQNGSNLVQTLLSIISSYAENPGITFKVLFVKSNTPTQWHWATSWKNRVIPWLMSILNSFFKDQFYISYRYYDECRHQYEFLKFTLIFLRFQTILYTPYFCRFWNNKMLSRIVVGTTLTQEKRQSIWNFILGIMNSLWYWMASSSPKRKNKTWNKTSFSVRICICMKTYFA